MKSLIPSPGSKLTLQALIALIHELDMEPPRFSWEIWFQIQTA